MTRKRATVGVLALQGDYAEHEAVLRELGVSMTHVRKASDLSTAQGLIIPGGESTAIGRLLDEELRAVIGHRAADGSLAVYGTCAGAILLAAAVGGKNAPLPLGVLDIDVERNAYGNQRESFEAVLQIEGLKGGVRARFIRAPRITRVGAGVQTLASHGDSPVLVRRGRVMASTFHTELTGETAIHRLLVEMASR